LTKASEYADLLRTIGLGLDEQGAGPVKIVAHEHFMAITWDAGDGRERERVYNEFDLTDWQSRARGLRGISSEDSPQGERSELLRTLGQDLDALGVEMNSLTEQDDRFVVTGTLGASYYSSSFTFEELRAESAERRALRRAPAPARKGGSSWLGRLLGR
jgi:hypothetical protein